MSKPGFKKPIVAFTMEQWMFRKLSERAQDMKVSKSFLVHAALEAYFKSGANPLNKGASDGTL